MKLKNKKLKMVIVCTVLCGTLQVTGCGKEATPETDPKATADSAQAELEEFEYSNYKGKGIEITKYNGEDGDVEIPEEIDGEKVLVIDKETFLDCKSLTSITIPPSIEINDDTFSKFPSVIIKGYRNTSSIWYAQNNNLEYQLLDDSKMCVDYVEIYDTESDKYKVLYSGDSGVDGEYSKGASLLVKDGEAVLTLDGYNGGMIRTDEYGSLTIRLAEGSENNINAASGQVGINTNGSLIIEGNGSLSIAGGERSSGNEYSGGGRNGMFVNGDLTIRDRVKMYVRSGKSNVESNCAILVNGGNVTVANSYLEAAVGSTGVQSQVMIVYSDWSGEYGQILLDGTEITAGGNIVNATHEFDDGEFVVGQAISEKEVVRVIDFEYEEIENAAEYVRIEPKN